MASIWNKTRADRDFAFESLKIVVDLKLRLEYNRQLNMLSMENIPNIHLRVLVNEDA